MSREYRLYLDDMLEAKARIQEYTDPPRDKEKVT